MKQNKRGFLTVEASIFLPIFLIGLLTLAYLIKILWIQESAFYVLEKEARELSKRTYVTHLYEKSDNVLSTSFQILVRSKVYEAQPKDVEKVTISNYRYLYTSRGISGLITANLNYTIPIKMPIQFYDHGSINDRLLFRAFIGADDQNDKPLTFEEIQKEKKSELVWVFPKAGERYHKGSCSYISNKPRQIILTTQYRKKYDSCHLCKSSKISNGNIVYCFPKTGEVFHRGSCSIIDKYVISIEKEEAIEKGYTPCMKCGG